MPCFKEGEWEHLSGNIVFIDKQYVFWYSRSTAYKLSVITQRWPDYTFARSLSRCGIKGFHTWSPAMRSLEESLYLKIISLKVVFKGQSSEVRMFNPLFYIKKNNLWISMQLIQQYTGVPQNPDDQSLISLDLSYDLALAAQCVRLYGWGHIECLGNQTRDIQTTVIGARTFTNRDQCLENLLWLKINQAHKCNLYILSIVEDAGKMVRSPYEMLLCFVAPTPNTRIFSTHYKSRANPLIYLDKLCIFVNIYIERLLGLVQGEQHCKICVCVCEEYMIS